MVDPVIEAIEITRDALVSRPHAHWVVAFSGGKDSTAALKILLAARRRIGTAQSRLSVIYCDTGVENPILDIYVKSIIGEMRSEYNGSDNSIQFNVLQSPLQDRFFVRIIGRGYPPPTNSFRWCTRNLRILPVSRWIQSQDPKNTVLVIGLRQNESVQRDRSMRGSQHWQKQREGNKEFDLFLPIRKLDVPNVWDAIFWLGEPQAIQPSKLERIYRDASGECPVIKAPQSPPCASGRFGCWTCTVVRSDKSAKELIRSGYTSLEPYLQFRNWLSEIRNDPTMRWPNRRNGSDGLGPFTLEARKLILREVRRLEKTTDATIISDEEMSCIESLWALDHIPRLSFKDRVS